MSTHKCEVVKVELREHPNADVLSIVPVFGWQCVVRTDEWSDGDLAVYVPPDSVIPDTEEIGRLGGMPGRIRVMRLRGVISMGLLMRAPSDAKEGDDLMEALGVVHYEPPLPMSSGGEAERGPDGFFPHYDVENYRNSSYASLISVGEEVVITEKIHGGNSRFVWAEGRQWAGSRKEWKARSEKNLYWRVLARNPWLEKWCESHPGIAVYGEVFGPVQNLKYGAQGNDIFFAAFDILDERGAWLDYDDALTVGDGLLQWVPLLYRGPFDEDAAKELAEGDSSVPGAAHMREGAIIKPIHERRCLEIGRVQLKLVSNRYLAKKEKHKR